MIKVIINGANGKMGQEVVKAISQDKNLQLVACLGRQDNLQTAIKTNNPDVVIDFTVPERVYENTKTIINANAHPVIGTTGLTPEQIKELQHLSAQKNLGGIIAPNFSIGAILMMRFASAAARYLNHVEIIELHHEKKKDAPSGTAIKTAELIAENFTSPAPINPCKELLPGALGALKNNIHIHSVRLPGFVAHQQVIFGGIGESLTLRHDTIHRECFMPGVVLACKKVMEIDRLIYGLEQII